MIDLDTGFNTALNKFKTDITNFTAQSDLPVGAVYYVMKDFLYDLEKAYKETLKIEKTILEQKDVEQHQE